MLKTVNDINFKIPGLRIISKIGEGGMSVVYLAEQVSLKREVAVKVMRLEIADNDLDVQRFKHEAKTIAQLDHPNIINIYNIGQTSTGEIFFTMPYLNHGDLSSYLIEDERQFIDLLKSVCDGLSFAHDHGVIHRDIKPENLLFDKFGNIRIADFGIAISKDGSRMTKEHQIVGSAQYMSPEQARSLTVDLRTDIYSLGIVIYERLTGRVPFDSDESISILVNHVSTPPPPLPPKMKHWQKLIDKCLAKEPDDRFQSMVELKIALDKVPVNTLQRTNDSIQTLLANPVWKKVWNKFENKKWLVIGVAGVLFLMMMVFLFTGGNEETENHQQQQVVGQKVENPQLATHEIESENNLQTGGLPTENNTDTTNFIQTDIAENERQNTQQQSDPVQVDTNTENKQPEINQSSNNTENISDQEKTDIAEKAEPETKLAPNQSGSPETEKSDLTPLAVIKQNLKSQNDPWGAENKTSVAEIANNPDIEQLLTQASENIEKYQLTKPADDNAMDQLLQVLQISPGNERALQGLAEVGTKYFHLINSSLQKKDYTSALTHYQSLVSFKEKTDYNGPESDVENQTLIQLAEQADVSSDEVTAQQVETLESFLTLISPESRRIKELENIALQKNLPKIGDKLLDSKKIESVLISENLAAATKETTVDQYREFAEATGRAASKCKHKGGNLGSFFSTYTWMEPPFDQTGKDPIICVSYEDAVAYSDWLGQQTGNKYRLPTQKEWLMLASMQSDDFNACKSGNAAGEEADKVRNRDKNYDCNDGFVFTAPVASFGPDALGLYDLRGNVSEWVGCESDDCGSPTAMGSSWYNGVLTNKQDASDRLRNETGYSYVGIRLVRDL